MSFAQLSEAVNSCVLLLWPLACGLGAALCVRLRRLRVFDQVRAWPGAAAVAFIRRELFVAWCYGVAGGFLTVVLAAVLGLLNSSPPFPAFAGGFFIACAGLFAWLGVGAVVGALIPSYAVAMILVAAIYGGSWWLATSTFDPVGFTGATMVGGNAALLRPAAVSGFTVSYAAVTLGALGGLLLALGGSLRRYAPKAVAAVVAGIVVSGAAVFGARDLADSIGYWQHRGPSAWECRTVGTAGSQAYLTRDLGALHDEYFTAMGHADALLRAAPTGAVDASTALVYAPRLEVLHAPIGARLVPMETDLQAPLRSWSARLSSYLRDPAHQLVLPSASSGEECWGSGSALQEQAESVLRGHRVNTAALCAQVAAATECDD